MGERGTEKRAHLLEVPTTLLTAGSEATHECGGCGRLLRLGDDRNWPLHGCGKGGRRLPTGLVQVYPSEEDMRFGPSYIDAATAEFIREVVVPNRKPLDVPPLPLDDS